jgi:hypothetical protein
MPESMLNLARWGLYNGSLVLMPVILAIALLLTPGFALSHGGRTNAEGCHNNRKTGGYYHCHNSGKSSYKSSASSYKQIATYDGPSNKTSRRLNRQSKSSQDTQSIHSCRNSNGTTTITAMPCTVDQEEVLK